MTTETETTTPVDDKQEQADAEAAFSAGFEGKAIPKASKPAETAEPQKTEQGAATTQAQATPDGKPAAGTEQTTTTEPATAAKSDAAPTPAPSPKADDSTELRLALRRLEGRYGALHDELTRMKAGKEAEGKPAAATPLELAGLKEQYPELAEVLTTDLAKAIGNLGREQADPKQVEQRVSQLVQEGVGREAARLRELHVSDAHPSWQSDLFSTDAATGRKAPTADYLAWKTSIGADEAWAFEESDNPFYVIKKLNAFYEWKNKASKAKAEKQQRLEQAVTPQGVPRATPPTLSDRDAELKGFEEGWDT